MRWKRDSCGDWILPVVWDGMVNIRATAWAKSTASRSFQKPSTRLRCTSRIEFHEGLAPCVKILDYVVERLAAQKVDAARIIARRWQQTPTPIHLRLWAAIARDPWIATA